MNGENSNSARQTMIYRPVFEDTEQKKGIVVFLQALDKFHNQEFTQLVHYLVNCQKNLIQTQWKIPNRKSNTTEM